ncbi:MAG: hypothetical protein Q7U54_00490 [Bacteroidales bacterium]|nr:hypothetical protein [Bacteroidales bacterium]
MKKIVYFLLFAVLLAACTSVKQIGKVNMISNRNVDPKLNYDVISTYSGGSNRELKKSNAKTIEDAIDQTVRKVPGGEFLMNAKIYMVNGQYIAVEGDVWGVKSNVAYRGFKVGDKVTWKVMSNFKTGTIMSLKDDMTCLVETKNGDIIEKKYDDISKAE